MLIDPNRVTLRPGNDRRSLNIDYSNTEIGHLKIDAAGLIIESWAIHYQDRPLVDLVARCGLALTNSPIRLGAS